MTGWPTIRWPLTTKIAGSAPPIALTVGKRTKVRETSKASGAFYGSGWR